MLPEEVNEKLDRLPIQPGVYLFKDKKGNVVYVGKAKSLRNRVRSYFQASGSDDRYFIPILQKTIGDFDTIVTANEKEATILENTLIKEHRPRYNVKLRDDKDYLSLRLAAEDPWPRLDVVRRPTPDGARYFGPYHSATAARRTLHLINKHFQLRTCTDSELTNRKRPCLQYQIKRCPAPCVFAVDRAWYADQVRAVTLFLDNRHDELSRELVVRMQSAARDMHFELAAVYRDQLRAIEKVREGQRVVTVDQVDRDVLGLYREGELAEVAVLYVRSGKLADVATFSIKQAEIPDEEIIGGFLAEYYGRASGDDDTGFIPIPREVIVPLLPEGADGIAEWLSERAKHKVLLVCPKRGPRVALVDMARDNAAHAFAEKRRATDDIQERLRDLQERLRLETLPRRIECTDISHLGGGDAAGAIVAMCDGELDKKRYRSFHVRGSSSARGPGETVNDDYGAMYEVLSRRFRRARAAALANAASQASAGSDELSEPTELAAVADSSIESASESADWDLPDLFVVDGGRGQLAVAEAAAHDLGLHDLAIVALAKERETAIGETMVDRVYLPGQKNPIPLKSNTASLFFLARLRDEAHRFSNRIRERLGKRRRFQSALDDIRGIGPITKKILLRAFGSVEKIRAATDEQLLAVDGVQSRHVKALRAVIPAPPRAPLPTPTPTGSSPGN